MVYKNLLIKVIVLSLMAPIAFSSPRSYGKTGTATNTNTTVTTSFGPSSLVICDDEASGGTSLYADPSDGVATTTDNSTNIKILAGECVNIPISDPNVLNVIAIGLITSSSTAAYRVIATR